MTARTAFVGDQITRDGDWESWLPDRGAINLGVDGLTSADLAGDRGSIVEAEPGSIVLLIGTNDLTQKKSIEHLVRNVQFSMVMLRKENPGARLLLTSVLPRGERHTEQLQDANRHLRQFCPTVNAQFLDLWPALAPDGYLAQALTDDGVHLNAAGYREWVAELGPALERLDEAAPMTRPISIIR